MEHASNTNAAHSSSHEFVPILFHHGCDHCLDICRTIACHIPGLALINLSRVPQFKQEALELGVSTLPSLVVGNKVVSVAAHTDVIEKD